MRIFRRKKEKDSKDPYPMTGDIWESREWPVTLGRPATDIFDRDEKYAAALLDPIGYRVIFGIPADAYDTIWHYYKYSGEPLDENTTRRLNMYRHKYSLYEVHTLAVALARIFGRSLVAKVPKSGPLDWEFRVFCLLKENIVYNDYGEVIRVRVQGTVGRRIGYFEFLPKDFVLYRDIQDPFGAKEDGIPAITPLMRTLIQLINMKWNIAKAVTMRGLGFLLVGLKVPPLRAANMINQIRQQWENPETYSTLVYPKQVMDVETLDSSVARSNVSSAIIEQYTKDIAGGAGIGTGKIQGMEESGKAGGTIVREENVLSLEKVHRIFDKYLVALFKLIDPKLPNFFIKHEYRLLSDPFHKAQKDNYIINAARLLPQLYKYNEVRRMLDLPPIEKFNGKLLAEVMAELSGGVPAPSGVGSSTTRGMLGQKDVNKQLKDKIRLRITENDSSLTEDEAEMAAKLYSENKETYAKALLRAGFSITKTNKILTQALGSGCSNSTLVRWRNELKTEKPAGRG